MTLKLSVIVPTFNAETTLPDCLNGLRLALGPDDEVIVADFAHSDVGLERLRIWAEANESNLATRLGAAPAAFMKADGRAMRIVIDQLVAEHGSIREFARTLGVTSESLTLLEQRLLVDNA